jgi:hypothetical protein
MHRSRFDTAAWMFFGTALIWTTWMLLLTHDDGTSTNHFNVLDVCGILPIAGSLAGAGIICGAIGSYGSHAGPSNCPAAIAANVMFLSVLLLYKFF